jgi:hypothetical protein
MCSKLLGVQDVIQENATDIAAGWVFLGFFCLFVFVFFFICGWLFSVN